MMLSIVGKKQTLVFSTLLTVILALFVILVVDPYIEGEHGASIVTLQRSFDRNSADTVLATWGSDAAARFNRSIWVDYLFALVYPVALASWLLLLISKKGLLSSVYCRSSIYIALSAGLFDWIEDSMELWYINKTSELPEIFFFLHSLAASAKFTAIVVAALCIVILLLKKGQPAEKEIR
jgi:hypothetical protein